MPVLYILAAIIIFFNYMPKLYRCINKKRHPFSGNKIETFTDVNNFMANKDFISFQDKDENGNMYEYTIVNVKRYTRIYDPIYNSKLIYIFKGIYKSEIGDDYWFDANNRINTPIRAFIWKHKDAINEQLEKERELKEKDRKEKEKILKLKKLDKNIKKDVFKIFKGN